jgi:hypothetical protein
VIAEIAIASGAVVFVASLRFAKWAVLRFSTAAERPKHDPAAERSRIESERRHWAQVATKGEDSDIREQARKRIRLLDARLIEIASEGGWPLT